jgi:2-phosphoglycerate kinase
MLLPDEQVSGGPGHAESELKFQTLIVEELGRRGMQCLSLTQLRQILQFAGCKPQQCSKAAVGLFLGLQSTMLSEADEGGAEAAQQRTAAKGLTEGAGSPTHSNSGKCSLMLASKAHTLRDQWSRRQLRHITSIREAQEISLGEHLFLVGLVPRVVFTQRIEALLVEELRGMKATREPLRRLTIVTSVVERRVPLVIFCGGTSGCGKSTLANLLASLLGIRTIVSTDSVRELLRGQMQPADCPELFASTYEAYKQLSPWPAKASPAHSSPVSVPAATAKFGVEPPAAGSSSSMSSRVVAAYEKQSLHVLAVLQRMLDIFIRRNESVVVEGVHLLSSFMLAKAAELAYNGIPCVPVLFQIVNEEKHKERFAIRAKSMTMLPRDNKYVEHFQAIRSIQAHLVSLATNTDVLIVNNTNVDKSLNIIHECTLGCLESYSTQSRGKGGTFMPTMAGRLVPKIKGKEVLEGILARREAKRTQERVRSAEARSAPHAARIAEPSSGIRGEERDGVVKSPKLASASPLTTALRSQSAGLPNRPAARQAHVTCPFSLEEDDHSSLMGS